MVGVRRFKYSNGALHVKKDEIHYRNSRISAWGAGLLGGIIARKRRQDGVMLIKS